MSLLKSTHKGQNIINYYEKHNILNSEVRAKLVEIISDHVILLKMTKGNATVDALANKIISLFPNEDKVRV